MFGPRSTAGKIDEYESRFTIVNGAHFLIAGNGREAWPISAAEAAEFKALYRRRMERARWIRRSVFLVPLLFILLDILSLPPPDALAIVLLPLYLIAVPVSLAQHPITSDLTRAGIERRLKRRITTRLPAAITPPLTPLGRFGKRLLIACVAIELGTIALHLALGRDAYAQHMRILYRVGNGQEGLLAQITGNLAWGAQFAAMLAILLLIVDRRSRRLAAERAKQADESAAAAALPRARDLASLTRPR